MVCAHACLRVCAHGGGGGDPPHPSLEPRAASLADITVSGRSAGRSYPLHFRRAEPARAGSLKAPSITRGRTGAARGAGGGGEPAHRAHPRRAWAQLGRSWARPPLAVGGVPVPCALGRPRWGRALRAAPGGYRAKKGRTWTLRGAPGAGRTPRGGLISFPRALRFLRSVSLTSLNFTALGPWPPAPPRGGSGGAGLGASSAQGWPARQGAGQAGGSPPAGSQALAGAVRAV